MESDENKIKTTLVELSVNTNITLIRIVRDSTQYEFDLTKECSFDHSNLDVEITTHAVKTAVIGSYLEEIQLKSELLSNSLKQLEAQLYCKIKNEDLDSKGKALSDKRIESMIQKDYKVNELRCDVIELQGYIRVLKMCMETLKSKERLMQTYSSNLRTTI